MDAIRLQIIERVIFVKPVIAQERIPILDIARGVAILGILLVNMAFYSNSLQAIQFQIELWPDFWNKAANKFLEIFVNGKFIAVFSFLFGYGMIVLKDRTVTKGRRFVPLYLRRLLALFLFGWIHGWFIWFGDILLHYALLGFVLLLFHKCKPRTLLVWAVLLIMLIPVLLLATGAEGTGTPQLSPEVKQYVNQMIERDQMIYGTGTYGEIQKQRVWDWNISLGNQFLFYPQLLGLFLLGASFAKFRLLHDVAVYHRVWIRICLWSGAIGLVSTLLPVGLEQVGAHSGLINQLNVIRHLIGSPLLGLFYIAILALLVRKQAWERALRPLANVGRMAFTNYIMQSVLCTLIFYSYGLGWYGKLNVLEGMLLSAAIFIGQMVISALWLRIFQMGPLEWIWRMLTYLSISPIRKKRSGAELSG